MKRAVPRMARALSVGVAGIICAALGWLVLDSRMPG